MFIHQQTDCKLQRGLWGEARWCSLVSGIILSLASRTHWLQFSRELRRRRTKSCPMKESHHEIQASVLGAYCCDLSSMGETERDNFSSLLQTIFFFFLFWDSVTIRRLGQLSIHDFNVLGSQKLHSHISGFVNIWHLFLMPFPSNIYSRKLKWLLKLVILLTISNGVLKQLGFFFSYSNVLFPHHVGSYGTAT